MDKFFEELLKFASSGTAIIIYVIILLAILGEYSHGGSSTS